LSAAVRQFALASADGQPVHGQADLPDGPSAGTVVLVHGSGAFNRDYDFGNSGTDRDLLGVTLSESLRAQGMTAVRYDKRSIDHPDAPVRPTRETRLSVSTTTLVDDLAAVYDWVLATTDRVVFLAHSEGVSLLGRLAERGAVAPALLLGVCGPVESPVSLLRRQIVDEGGEALYEQYRAEALAHADDDPWPHEEGPLASFGWWRTWFLDDVPVGLRLQPWQERCELHYGGADAQVPADVQVPLVESLLPGARAVVHPGRGHTLGNDPQVGPMDPDVIDQLVRAAARACTPLPHP
jgi:hypothetical protein